ncbi:PTS system maltose and glucose-specific IIC component [Paenibacillus sp. SORGH_AS338]|uniref:maltose/glucose-specific PTS transporter subunit IIC n=1 Tax=Paenibacillus sp. SORGH_AS_0338 TaxID=3041755 RepID=UPI0028561ACE|nr:maltose/glucose-specific PTS transporter subunit IIC [Paenibacillus sp. SORGH_AS_0338]MDR6109558.1 PTS system maltose and glucose-specific IIC component [Paenibacillus sp. SORGH_AS_0338]
MKTFFEKAQRFGKSFMLPIAVLPAAGLLLGIGGALSNPNTVSTYPVLQISWLQYIFKVMSSAGDITFSNLALIFAIGVAVGLARSDKGTAGLAAALAYLVMNASINAMLINSNQLVTENMAAAGQGMILGIQSLQTGVLGGIIIGLVTAGLHNRYNKIELPQFLGFFGGSRFIPIVSSFAAIFVGLVLFLVWPTIQLGITKLGGIVDATGYVGTLFYGFFLRMLGPLGLHHIFYLPFWQTGLGGTMEVSGKIVEGTQNIFFAQLGDPSTEKYFSGTSRFMSGRFITMMFGLLGAALAIYHTARPERKKVVGGLMLSAALTSFLTGITEPLEFAFLFVAPFLYVIHAVFDGFAFMLAHIFQITIGQTFSGGLIDFILFGILQGNAKTNWIYVPIIGVVWFALYYFTFRFLIVKFNLKTPGREDETVADTNENTTGGTGSTTPITDAVATDRSEVDTSRPAVILRALGGKENIKDLDCCATRLRISVYQPDQVSQDRLKHSGAKGVLINGNGVQVIYGPQVSVIKNEIEEYMEME